MKAVGLYKYLPIDHEESLLDIEVDKPVPKEREILVKVEAVSVNPVDTKVRAPKETIEEQPRILGWDVAGVVDEVGPDCTLFEPGDEVYYAGSIDRQGGNSEYHLVDERIVGHKPVLLSYSEAAALPLTTITAWEGLFERLGVKMDPRKNASKSILIIGAAGGVGSIAVQLAKMAGLKVIGTASRPESSKWAMDRGADFIINHHEPFGPQLTELGIHNGVNYIFCLHSTDQHWDNMADAIAPQGNICSIVETDKHLDLTLLKNKSVTFSWEFMFTRPLYKTGDMIEQYRLLNKVSKFLDDKKLETTAETILSPINANNLQKAHKMIESGRTIGKIVIADFE